MGNVSFLSISLIFPICRLPAIAFGFGFASAALGLLYFWRESVQHVQDAKAVVRLVAASGEGTGWRLQSVAPWPWNRLGAKGRANRSGLWSIQEPEVAKSQPRWKEMAT
jgi:hypothetical protein